MTCGPLFFLFSVVVFCSFTFANPSAFPPTRNITEICTTHNNRPPFSKRLFVSPFIDALVEVGVMIGDT